MAVDKNKDICFVIMPISDPEGYEEGHFDKIYNQIFKPAIMGAGYEPHRVDEDKSSGIIQAKILQSLLDAPIVLCDLTTLNPNVLFELGLRQAFDKPVVLVQEVGTRRIFDISTISTVDYRKNRLYDEVIDDHSKITQAILETGKNNKYNSLMSFLAIESASIDNAKPIDSDDATKIMFHSIMNEINDLKNKDKGTNRISVSTKKDYRTRTQLEACENKIDGFNEFIYYGAQEENELQVLIPEVLDMLNVLDRMDFQKKDYLAVNDYSQELAKYKKLRKQCYLLLESIKERREQIK